MPAAIDESKLEQFMGQMVEHMPTSAASTSMRRPSSTARQRADEAGVAASTTFGVADAKSCPATYDLICFFGCLHDRGDPVGIARY